MLPNSGPQFYDRLRGWRNEAMRASVMAAIAWSGFNAVGILASNWEYGCFDYAPGCDFWYPFFGWLLVGALPSIVLAIGACLLERRRRIRFFAFMKS